MDIVRPNEQIKSERAINCLREEEIKENEAGNFFSGEVHINLILDSSMKNFTEIFNKYVLQTFKYERSLTIEQKINFTSILVHYRPYLDLEEFFEEECHLSMVQWIYSNIALFSIEDDKIFHLLYNIIIIFEVLPINVNDLFELKIFDKLNKIRKLIKNKRLYIFHHLDNLLNYWTNFCTKKCINKRSEREYLEYSEDKDFFEPNKKVCIIFNVNLNKKI